MAEEGIFLSVIFWTCNFQVVKGPTGRLCIANHKEEEHHGAIFIHCLFVNKILDFITPKQVFSTVFDMVFGNHTRLDKVKFGWRYTSNLKKIVCRAEFLRSDTIPPCLCHNFKEFTIEIAKCGFHVCTSNLNIIHDKQIKKLFRCGLNHIPTEPLNPHIALGAIIECLADLALNLQLEESKTLAIAR